jgi:hypothetical protein
MDKYGVADVKGAQEAALVSVSARLDVLRASLEKTAAIAEEIHTLEQEKAALEGHLASQ